MAVVLAAGASAAKPADPAIKAITTYSNGADSDGACYLRGSLGWSARLNHGRYAFQLKTAQGAVVSDARGPLPRTSPSMISNIIQTSELAFCGYYFTLMLQNAKGVAVDTENTTSFSIGGCLHNGIVLGRYPW